MVEENLSAPAARPFTNVETAFVTVRDEEYHQLLDEWAEIVYQYLCQLSEKKLLVPETLAPPMAERTGTDEF